MTQPTNKRILVVDDNANIRSDFEKTLLAKQRDESALSAIEAAFFDDAPPAAAPAAGAAPASPADDFEVVSAAQGLDAVALVDEARRANRPFAMAFVDMRMPPGIDGVETIERIWKADPDVQIVVCTAYSDHSWQDMVRRLGRTDRLLVLKKPFDAIEACQLATALTEKWSSTLALREQLEIVQRAEGEARAYGSMLETVNTALETSWRRTEAELHSKRRMLLGIAESVLTPALDILTRSISTLDPSTGSKPSPEELEYVVERSSELVRTLQTLIELAEVDAQTEAPPRISCDPRELVDSALVIARQETVGKPIEVVARVERSVPETMLTSPERVGRILGELVHNAVRHTDRGRLAIEVGLHQGESGEPSMLRFAVTDSGSGVEPELLSELFEPLFTSSPGRQGGLRAGLGLAVCQRLAGSMGGNLRHLEAPTGGATFELLVPCS